jgi:hypothetical protein
MKMQPKRRKHLFNKSINAHRVASHIYSLKMQKKYIYILNISFAKKVKEHSRSENSVDMQNFFAHKGPLFNHDLKNARIFDSEIGLPSNASQIYVLVSTRPEIQRSDDY